MTGTSIIVSSGDDGAPGNFGDCNGAAFDPPFPASSPYVTTVGATMMTKSSDFLKKEVASDDPICKQNKGCLTSKDEIVCTYPTSAITSGGGFSTYTPRPSY